MLQTLKDNIKAMLPFLGSAAMKLAERVLEYVVTADMHGQVLAPHAVVQTLQFLAEISPLHVKVENFGVVDEHGERPVRQRRRRLTQDLIQHDAVQLCHTTHTHAVSLVTSERSCVHRFTVNTKLAKYASKWHITKISDFCASYGH